MRINSDGRNYSYHTFGFPVLLWLFRAMLGSWGKPSFGNLFRRFSGQKPRRCRSARWDRCSLFRCSGFPLWPAPGADPAGSGRERLFSSLPPRLSAGAPSTSAILPAGLVPSLFSWRTAIYAISAC